MLLAVLVAMHLLNADTACSSSGPVLDKVSWSFVDGNTTNGINKDATIKAYSPLLTFCNSVLYATWEESNHVRIAVYNGDDLSPMWTFIDGNGTNGMNRSASNSASSPQLTAWGSKLYATWQEAGQIRVVVGK